MRKVGLAVLAAVAMASGASAQTPAPAAAPAKPDRLEYEGPPPIAPAPTPARPTVIPVGANAFALCDGYGAPNKNGDGMTEPAWSWGGLGAPQGGAGDTTRRRLRLGETGVRMCDAALSADTLPASFDLRRASLLRARALHRLALNDVKGALADLELARAAALPASRAVFDRSVGVGVDYVQAYAMGMAGDTAGARALIRTTFARRPYSRQSALAALIVADSLDDAAELERATRETARLAPESVDDLFGLLVEQGRWTDALAVWPQLVPPREKDETPYYAEMRMQGDRNYVSAARYWADKGGWRAYALAASGRPAEARAALAEARERLARDAVPPPPPKARKKPDPAFEQAYFARERLAKEGAELLDRWAPVVEARALVAEGRAAEALPLAQGATLDEPRLRADLIAAVRAGLPAAEQAKLPAPAPPPTRHDILARLPRPIVLAFLMQTLPEAERAEDLPRYKAGAASAWSGWDVDPRADGVKVTFRHNGTAPAAVEEMALLRAAEAALAAGKPGLVVLDRKDLRQMLMQTYNGVPVGTPTPAGYSTELEVRFTDAPAGEGYAGGWRVLDAAAVRAALAPAYPARTAER